MITFKSPEDLQKVNPNDPVYTVIKKLVDVLINAYTWPGHPYVPLWKRPSTACWMLKPMHFVALELLNATNVVQIGHADIGRRS